MEAHLRTERDHAFVLTGDDLNKIWSALERDIGLTSAEIGFSDSIERKVSSLEDLLAFENSNKKKIKRIEIYGKSASDDNRARVLFSDSIYRPIEVSATGEDNVVTKFGDNIAELIDGLKPWYAFISRLDFFYIIGFVCWIAFMLLDIITPDSPNDKTVEVAQGIKIVLILLGILSGISLSIWGLNRLRSIYFPFSSFAIGQGKERHRVQENVRWGVVVAFVVSLAASTFFAMLR